MRWQVRGLACLMVLWSLGLAYCLNLLMAQAWPAMHPLARHISNALVLYFLGLLPIVLVYLRWLAAATSAPAALLASPAEQQDYVETSKQATRWLDKLSLAEGVVYLDMLLPALGPVIVLVAGLLIAPALLLSPFALAEWMASVLAELVIEFVLGYALIRRAQVPTQQLPTYSHLFKRSWGYGLVIVFVGFFVGMYQQFYK